MQIGDLGWLNGEALIADLQIALQKLIRRVQRGDVREPHLLDHPILKGLKAPRPSNQSWCEPSGCTSFPTCALRSRRVKWSMPASRNQPGTVSALTAIPWHSVSYSAANVGPKSP
jgi:hypothetical protein